MAAIDQIIKQVRGLLRDEPTLGTALFTGDGVLQTFDLPFDYIEDNNPAPVVQIQGGAVLAQGIDYNLDAQHGVLQLIKGPLAAGAVLIVTASYYEKFINSQLHMWVQIAAIQHLYERVDAYDIPLTLDTMPIVEQYLVAVRALIEALYIEATDSSGEVDVMVPDGVTIPRSERFRMVLDIIAAWERKYLYLCAQLNVGIQRIQMFDLRRQSYTTGRLVPIYKEREFDAPYKGFYPDIGQPGAIVTINGRFLLSVTAVLFGGPLGVPATYTTNSDFQIQAIVPNAAVTGPITLVSPGGNVTTTMSFTVGTHLPQINYGAVREFPTIDQKVLNDPGGTGATSPTFGVLPDDVE